MSYSIIFDHNRLRDFLQSSLYCKETDYAPLLFQAISLKDYEIIPLFSPLTECFDDKGNSPLHKVCKNDCSISIKLKLLQTLLSNGINPQILDKYNNTILHISDDKEIIKLFLETGMNPKVLNKNLCTPKEAYLRRNYPPGSEIGGWGDRDIIKLFETYENMTVTKKAIKL